jgi:hypothetical protein
MSSLIYIPADNRLAHDLNSNLKVETFDLTQKQWIFEVFNYSGDLVVKIILNLEKEIEDSKLEMYELIVQQCLNGDRESKNNLDRLGILSGTSAWRCDYCGGVFGNTYNDCVIHEKECLMNPKNKD